MDAGSVVLQEVVSVLYKRAYIKLIKSLLHFRYDSHLTTSCQFGINKGLAVGIGLGIFQITTLGTYAFSLWYVIVNILSKRECIKVLSYSSKTRIIINPKSPFSLFLLFSLGMV